MTDELIASGLAALGRENQQRIPAFAFPEPQSRLARRALTWALVTSAAPTAAMLAVGVALVALDIAPFGHYEPFAVPFVVAIVSLVGVAIDPRPRPLTARMRMYLTSSLAAAALVVATIAGFVNYWPGYDSMYVWITDDCLWATTSYGGDHPYSSPGFVLIAAVLALVIARAIAARLNPETWRNRRYLEAWGTSALIIGVLVVIVWSTVYNFERRYWPLVGFRLPDPALHSHIGEHVKGAMWHALRFRPWSVSSISSEQVDLGAATGATILVAIATALAIIREQRTGRSRWLRLLELPILLPLGISVGMFFLVRATVADGPSEGAYPFAWAVGGVMLALTSMILRRRRSISCLVVGADPSS